MTPFPGNSKMSAFIKTLVDVSIAVNLYLILLFGMITRTAFLEHCGKDDHNSKISKYASQTCSAKYKTTEHLKRTLRDWDFAADQLLQKTFPMDPETQNYVRRDVRNAVFSYVKPTAFQSEIKLAAASENALRDILDLHPAITENFDFVKMVAGNGIIKGSKPMSHRYGGHQFGVWADQLGDGRAHMLGEYVNAKGERWELQLKGSGNTPYSRDADGRAVIRSSVREFLCSEAMYRLGVPSSRAATLVVSNDPVMRDQFYDGRPRQERGAVVLRLAQSWFRIGSLEILTDRGETDLLQKVTDFVIEHHFPRVDPKDPDKYLAFYAEVVSQTATMIAGWMSVGFAHGVCNTDNFSLLSITIDYGPFGFMDAYDPEMVPNTSDDEGRYSYENQPDVGKFNMNKLRIALLPLLTSTQQSHILKIYNGYVDIYKKKFMEKFRNKLGIKGIQEEDENLVAILLKMMADKKADFTLTFRQLGDLSLSSMRKKTASKELWALQPLRQHKWFNDWLQMYVSRIERSGISDEDRQKNMHKINPRYILRNWMAQEVIEKVEKDNFNDLKKVLRILENPFEEQEEAELSGYADPPPQWAKHLKVSCSS